MDGFWNRRVTPSKIIMLCISVIVVVICVFFYISEKKESEDTITKYLENEKKAAAIRAEKSEAERIAKEKEAAEIEAQHLAIRNQSMNAGLDEKDGTLLWNQKGDQSITDNKFTVDLSKLSGTGTIKLDCEAVNKTAFISVESPLGKSEYAVSTKRTEVYIPVKSIEKVDLIVKNQLLVHTIELYQYTENDISKIKAGTWITDEYTHTEIDYGTGISTKGAYACIANENRLFVSYTNCLEIYDVSDGEGHEKLIQTIEDVKTGRHMCFSKNGNVLIVTARQNGVYLLDISDNKSAKIISHIDALELATGVSTADDYMFICSRYFGVEIWNIKDPANPVFCSVTEGGVEYQNCFYDNNVLYVAVYNQCKIVAFDVTNPYSPVKKYELIPEGKPYALYVKDNLLYTTVAVSDLTHNNSMDPAYGLSNGFVVYDIKNPKSPEKITAAKIDGRFDVGAFDTFGLSVIGKKLYLSHTYNGIYIYDITRINDPVLLENIRIPIYSYDEDKFKEQTGKNLWPFDRELYMPDPVLDFSVSNEKIYLAGVYTGVYSVTNKNAILNTDQRKYACTPQKVSSKLNITGWTTEVFSDYDVRAVSVCDKKYFIACGNNGIVVTDQKYNKESKIDVPGIVRDVKARQKDTKTIMVYCASDKGVYIYSYQNAEYEQISFIQCSVRELQISENGNMILAVGDRCYLFSFNEKDGRYKIDQLLQKSISGLYYRNIMNGLVSDKFAAIQTNSEVNWWNLAEETEETMDISVTASLSEGAGYAAYKDKCLAIYKGGYILYDPESKKIDLNELKAYNIPGSYFRGIPSVLNNKTLVSIEYTGAVWIVDIENAEDPKLIVQFKIPCGSDIAVADGESILIPARHSGLIKITKNKQ